MTATWITQIKPGTVTGGWFFNEPGYIFNQLLDSISEDAVMFNGSGKTQTWSTQNKS